MGVAGPGTTPYQAKRGWGWRSYGNLTVHAVYINSNQLYLERGHSVGQYIRTGAVTICAEQEGV